MCAVISDTGFVFSPDPGVFPICSSLFLILSSDWSADRQAGRQSRPIGGRWAGRWGSEKPVWWKSLAWTCSAWHGPPSRDVSVDPDINPSPSLHPNTVALTERLRGPAEGPERECPQPVLKVYQCLVSM